MEVNFIWKSNILLIYLLINNQCENLIKDNLKFVGFDEGLLLESKNWEAGKGSSFKLQKD